jgi:arylsulfatase A-like enzyme
MRRLTALAVAVLTLAGTSNGASAQEVPQPPNLVVIITDDMRFDLMQHMPTVMADLVGQGRSFERGFIVDPWCCPSRTSFLRGQYAHTTSVFDIDGPWGGWQQVRDAGLAQETLAVWLDRAGYYTGEVGKAGTDTTVVDGLSGIRDKARWEQGWKSWSASKASVEGYQKPLKSCRTLLSVDDGVGRILGALDAKDPGLDNTVIIFTSDQGIQYGEHNWPNKRVPYEGTIRVPFVVRADGILGDTAPTTDVSNIVLNIDVAPTFVELAGAVATPGCPAASQEPYFSRCTERGGASTERVWCRC